jgi:hypothetical protein
LYSDKKYSSDTVGKFGPWITSSREKTSAQKWGFGEELHGPADYWQ